jgi:hypothetical protein
MQIGLCSVYSLSGIARQILNMCTIFSIPSTLEKLLRSSLRNQKFENIFPCSLAVTAVSTMPAHSNC